MRALSNIDIDKMFAGNSDYGGCLSKDLLPKTSGNKFFILNLDDDDGPGTHWTAIYCCLPDKDLYFDSYGVDPPQEVLKMLKSSKKPLIVNDVQVQSMTSSSCGWYAVAFVKELQAGKKMSDIILKGFTDRIGHSEEYLKTLFNSFFKILD